MSNRSTLSDTTILQGTAYVNEDDKGRVQLQYVLPTGRVITSTDKLVRTEIKGRVLIAWADAIRDADTAELQAKEDEQVAARAQRRALRPYSAAPTDTPANAPASSAEPSAAAPGSDRSFAEIYKALSTLAPLPDSPNQLVAEKLSTLQERGAILTAEIKKMNLELEYTLRNLEKWAQIAQALGVSLTQTVTSEPEPKPARKGRPRGSKNKRSSADQTGQSSKGEWEEVDGNSSTAGPADTADR